MRKEPKVGEVFGRLTVLKYVVGPPSGWLCSCSCGGSRVVSPTRLRTGHTKSCGCRFIEGVSTHGLSKSKTYKTWQQMVQRCTNEKATGYENYGGRGITICERWMKFENFLADMGERPEGKSLDRRTNDGNYEPGNCRWATPKEQQINRRVRVMVKVDGQVMRVRDACLLLGVHSGTIHKRIKRGVYEVIK